MFVKDAGSGNNGEVVQTGLSGSKVVADVSPDGNAILYQYQPAAGASVETYGQSLVEGKPFLIGPAVDGELPRLSPDGKWVALPSDESGSVEIVVRPFSLFASGGATQVSFGGGHDPRWSRDGRELFYRNNDWYIVSVPLLDLSKHRFGKPATLFRLLEGSEYDVADGKSFLVSEPVGQSSAPPFVIANWKPAPPTSH
jgi:Tol biopolymer transport system component